METPLEHVAAIWPGFLTGRPLGNKTILRPRADQGWACSTRAPSFPAGTSRKLAEELLFISARPEAGTREAQLAAIGDYLDSLVGAPECYVSVNTFFGRRWHKNLKHLTCLMVDLDLSKAAEHGNDYAGNFMRMRQDALDALSSAGISTPNLATHTGRGVHLYWLFDRALPAAAAPRWQACLKVLIKLLRPFGSDPTVSDTARVLRIVGTINSAAPPHCRRVTAEVLVAQRVAFDFLADQILPLTRAALAEVRSARLIELAPQRAARDARRRLRGSRQGEASEVSTTAARGPGRSFGATAAARLTDLTLLATSLFPQGVSEGNRDRYLFAVTCNLAWICREETLLQEVLRWKNTHIPNMGDEDATCAMGAALRKAQESYQAQAAGERTRPYADPRYLHASATLWQMFGADIERAGLVASMQAILPDGVLKERRQAARRAKSPDHYTRQGIREANVPRALQALQLRGEGLSLREIAQALATTPKTISAWLALPPEALGLAPAAQVPASPSAAADSLRSTPAPCQTTPKSYPQIGRVLTFERQVLPKCSLTSGVAQRVFEDASSMQAAQEGAEGIWGPPPAEGLRKITVRQGKSTSPRPGNVVQLHKPRHRADERVLDIGKSQHPHSLATGGVIDSAAGPQGARPRRRFDEDLLGDLRRWSLQDGLKALGLHHKADASYAPRTSDERVHVTRDGGQVVELVLSGIRWFDTRAEKGGGGVIDLAVHLLECDFVSAVRALTLAWPAARPSHPDPLPSTEASSGPLAPEGADPAGEFAMEVR